MEKIEVNGNVGKGEKTKNYCENFKVSLKSNFLWVLRRKKAMNPLYVTSKETESKFSKLNSRREPLKVLSVSSI